MQDLKTKLTESTLEAATKKTGYRLLFKERGEEKRHEMLFFIKPEVTGLAESIQHRILELVFSKFDQFGLAVREAALLDSDYLERYDIVARHYGVINALSRDPLGAMSPDAKEQFSQVFGLDANRAPLIGSIPFLEEFPELDPESLNQLWQSSKAIKLSGGTYCAPVERNGQLYYLVNGFHPKQLEHFTLAGRSVLAFALAGDVQWQAARNEFIGKTNPADAAPGSLRNELFRRQQEFGLKQVSASLNGFHLSAGPLEALVELIRYGSDLSRGPARETGGYSFGRQLLAEFPEEMVSYFLRNGMLSWNNKKINAFDLTEEKDADAAVGLLKEARRS